MNHIETIEKHTIELHKSWRLVKLLSKESGEVSVRIVAPAIEWEKAIEQLQGLPDIPVQAYIEIENSQYEPVFTYPPGEERHIAHSAVYTPTKKEEKKEVKEEPKEAPKKE